MQTSSGVWLPMRSFPKPYGFWASFFLHLHDTVVPHARNGYHPHALKHRALGLLAVFICVVKVVAISASLLGPASLAVSAEINVPNIIALSNEARRASGVLPLAENTLLNQAAQAKAEHMLQNGYFAHVSPSGVTPWDWFSRVGYKYASAGENLAVNFTDDQEVVDAWLQSPGHRANLLNDNFTEIGIGVATGPFEGHVATFVVQMFGLPQPTALANTNPQARTSSLPRTKRPTTPQVKQVQVDVPALPEVTTLTPPSLEVLESSAVLSGSTLEVSASLSDAVISARVEFSGQTFDLNKNEAGKWSGSGQVLNSSGSVVLKVFDKDGKELSQVIAKIAPSANSAFGPTIPLAENFSSTSPAWEKLYNMDKMVYPILISALLAVLAISVAVRRHAHHPLMIANASFVVTLASVLWMV